jgi:hypothetical protein
MPTPRPRAAFGRPYVICHMVPSEDGRIVTNGWPLPRGLLSECERTAATLDGDAWAHRRRGGLLWLRYRARRGHP